MTRGSTDGQDLGHVQRRQPAPLVKTKGATLVFGEDAVEDQRVKMDVEVQRAAEALDDHHTTAASALDAVVPRTLPKYPRDGPEEDARHHAAQPVVPSQLVSQASGHRQHPLPDAHVRQYGIDQMCRTLRHTPRAATGTERPVLARERDQPIESARAASEPGKSAGQPSTAQERAEGMGHETGQPLVAGTPAAGRTERLEVVADDLVDHPVLGASRLVGGRQSGHDRDRARPAPAPTRTIGQPNIRHDAGTAGTAIGPETGWQELKPRELDASPP